MERSAPTDVIPVEVERLERIRDVLARISLREFDPATDLFPITGDDAFASFEDTISLFARQLHASVSASEEAIARLEAAQRELEDKLGMIDRQRRAIHELSTPVLELVESVVTMPILGEIDSERARLVTDALLQRIANSDVRCAIVDVTGVPIIDTHTADVLIRMVASARLLGTYCVVTGIRPGVAETLTELGIDVAEVQTVGSLRDGLRECIRYMRREETSALRRVDGRRTGFGG